MITDTDIRTAAISQELQKAAQSSHTRTFRDYLRVLANDVELFALFSILALVGDLVWVCYSIYNEGFNTMYGYVAFVFFLALCGTIKVFLRRVKEDL